MSVDSTSGDASFPSAGNGAVPPSDQGTIQDGGGRGPSVAELLSRAGRRPLGRTELRGTLPPVPPRAPEAPPGAQTPASAQTPAGAKTPAGAQTPATAQTPPLPAPSEPAPSEPAPAAVGPVSPPAEPSPPVGNPVLAAQLAAATSTGLSDPREETPDAIRDLANAALAKVASDSAMRAEAPREEKAPVRRGLLRDLRALAFFSAAVNLLLLAMPLHMLAVYERVLSSGSGATLLYITLLAMGALVLLGIAEVVRVMVAQRMSAAYVTRTAEPLFRGLMRDGETAIGPDGEPLGRGALLRSFYALRSVLASRAVLGVLDLPFTLVFVVLLFALNVQIGFITLFGIAILAGLAWLERRMAADNSSDATRANSEAVAFSQAFVSRAEDIRAMGLFPHVLRHWGTRIGRAITHADDAARINATFFGISRTVRQALQVLIIAWGAWLVLQGDLSGGMIFAASLISGRAISPVEQVIGSWDRLQGGWKAYNDIEHFLAGTHDDERAVVPTVTAGDLAVEGLGVEVSSGGRLQTILHGISFRLTGGECLAIVGPSGAGKSTLAKCLSGAIAPTTGSVRLDDFDLARWPDVRRRQSIGYVPQDSVTFPGTIAENIAGFSATPDDDAIVAAARAADIHAHVVRLPEGYSTLVGPSGHELSGGQRGQIALARAFYANPRVLVLDEPNAHLDQAAEEGFLRTIARLKSEGVAVIVVSQRRSVLKVADTVLTLNGGRVVSFVANHGQWRARRGDGAEPGKPESGRAEFGKAELRVSDLPVARAGSPAPGPGAA